MSEDADGKTGEQLSLDDYPSSESGDDKWQCVVCGALHPTITECKDCHSLVTAPQEKAQAANSTGTQTEFLYPVALSNDLIQFCSQFQRKIHELEDENLLEGVLIHIHDTLPINDLPGESGVFRFFSHAVCVQGLGLLPGYPRYTRTMTDSPDLLPLVELISKSGVVKGEVTDEMIDRSYFVTTERINRSKIHRVTKSYWEKSSLVAGSTPWEWVTFSSTTFPDSGYATEKAPNFGLSGKFRNSEFKKTAVFDEGAAHNMVVIEARNWIKGLESVGWASAPFVEPAPDGVIEKMGIAEVEPAEDPVWMFDFAGYSNDQELLVLGEVVDGNSPEEVLDQIHRISEHGVLGLVVWENRDEIESFLQQAQANDWISGDTPAEEYSHRPSIPTITTEAADDVELLSNIRFVTRKQLIDDMVDQADLFPGLTAAVEGS